MTRTSKEDQDWDGVQASIERIAQNKVDDSDYFLQSTECAKQAR